MATCVITMAIKRVYVMCSHLFQAQPDAHIQNIHFRTYQVSNVWKMVEYEIN